MHLKCLHCDGSGVDPDDATGKADCPECKGDGQARCERGSCREVGIVFNDDGELLCDDCAFEEAC